MQTVIEKNNSLERLWTLSIDRGKLRRNRQTCCYKHKQMFAYCTSTKTWHSKPGSFSNLHSLLAHDTLHNSIDRLISYHFSKRVAYSSGPDRGTMWLMELGLREVYPLAQLQCVPLSDFDTSEAIEWNASFYTTIETVKQLWYPGNEVFRRSCLVPLDGLRVETHQIFFSDIQFQSSIGRVTCTCLYLLPVHIVPWTNNHSFLETPIKWTFIY